MRSAVRRAVSFWASVGCVVLCCAVRRTVLCCIQLCRVVLCSVEPCRALLCCVVLCCAVLCGVVFGCVVLSCALSSPAVLCCAASCCVEFGFSVTIIPLPYSVAQRRAAPRKGCVMGFGAVANENQSYVNEIQSVA